MAGSAFRLNPTHVSHEAGQSRFRRANIVEASVTMLGHSFRTTIHEGATTNELIEKVAREHGGEVSRRYYPEFKTWEIVSVRIGDMALVKSSESGIHFSLGSAGIPMAATEDKGIVFPNGDELRIGRNTRNIALWTTSANFDPGSVGDLDRMYGGRGGVMPSREALDEISRAHGGGRSGKLVLEENILVLNKDTGEILTVSQYASKEAPQPAISPDAISISLPAYASCTPACPELRRFVPAQFDAFQGRFDRLVIRTFDGSIADFVRIQMNPFSQDKLDAGFASRLPEQKMIPLSKPEPVAQAPPPAFCLLAFGCENKRDGSGTPPSGQPPAAPGSPVKHSKCVISPSSEWTNKEVPPSSPSKCVRKTIPVTYDTAAKAWGESRFEPVRLSIPIGAISLKRRKTRKTERQESSLRKAWPAGHVRHVLAFASILTFIMRLMKERARKLDRDLKAKKAKKPAARASPAATERKKPLPRALSVSQGVGNHRNERRRKEYRIADQKKLRKRRVGPSVALQSIRASANLKRQPARRHVRQSAARFQTPAIQSVRSRRQLSLARKTGKRKTLPASYILNLLGLFSRKKRKFTGRAVAGN